MGISRYTTSDALIAGQIRQNGLFKRGVIIEEEVREVAPEENEKAQPKPRMAHVSQPQASWNEMSMGKGRKHVQASKDSAMSAIVNAQGVEDKADVRSRGERKKRLVQMEFFDNIDNASADKPAGDDGEEFQVGVGANHTETDGQMKIEDVEDLMSAKEYLKEVLHVPADKIRLKADMQAYCNANGISFPNYAI